MVAAGFMLASCSPDDVPGVKLSETGAPVLVNCGTYFSRVEAYDADTGRLVWSAGKRQGSSEHGVGEVEVGVLPDADWVENSPLRLKPFPAVWRFVVSRRGYDDPGTLTAAQSALSTDQVFIFESGKSVPADGFIGKTCGYDPPIPRAVTRAIAVTALVAALLGAAVVGTVYAVRRRKSKA